MKNSAQVRTWPSSNPPIEKAPVEHDPADLEYPSDLDDGWKFNDNPHDFTQDTPDNAYNLIQAINDLHSVEVNPSETL